MQGFCQRVKWVKLHTLKFSEGTSLYSKIVIGIFGEVLLQAARDNRASISDEINQKTLAEFALWSLSEAAQAAESILDHLKIQNFVGYVHQIQSQEYAFGIWHFSVP